MSFASYSRKQEGVAFKVLFVFLVLAILDAVGPGPRGTWCLNSRISFASSQERIYIYILIDFI